MVEDIKKVVVIGAGLMGAGIVQVSLMAGYNVTLVDVKDEFITKGLASIEGGLKRLEDKGKLIAADVMGRLKTTLDLSSAVKDADFIIEAVVEKMDVKKDVFKTCDQNAPSHCIIATNTSTMSITEMASVTNRQDKCIGMHFFNPVPLMRLVEIIAGKKSSDNAMELGVKVGESLPCLRGDRYVVKVLKDRPGFIVNRLNIASGTYLNWILDEAMKKGIPWECLDADVEDLQELGPCARLDYLGLDTVYNTSKYFEEVLSPDFAPSKALTKLVNEGNLGKKTGKGFYEHPGNRWQRPTVWSQDLADKFDPQLVVVVGINRAAELVADGVASPADIDKTMKLGFNQPVGTLELADSLGIDAVVKKLEFIAKEYNDFYAPHSLLKQMVKEGKLGMKAKEGFFKY